MSEIIKTFCDGEVAIEELKNETCPELCEEKECPFYKYYFSNNNRSEQINTENKDIQEISDESEYANIEVIFKRESTGEEIDISGAVIVKKEETSLENKTEEVEEVSTKKEETVEVKEKPKAIFTPKSRLSRIEQFKAKLKQKKEEEAKMKKEAEASAKSKKTTDKSTKIETSELSDALKALNEKFGK